LFHHFRQDWTIELSRALNAGRLPPGYVALMDPQTGGPIPDVLTLNLRPNGPRQGEPAGGLTVGTDPPRARDVKTGRSLRRESEGTEMVRAVAIPEGDRYVVTGTASGLMVYDLERSGPARVVSIPQGAREFVIDRTRNDVIVAGADGALSRVSLATLTAGERLESAHDGAIEAIAISRDGRMLATGGRTDGRVLLRDARSFGLLFALPPRTGIVKVLEFHSSGRWLAIAGAAADITLWDLNLVHDELAAIGLAWD
jgi:hypothetical protein